MNHTQTTVLTCCIVAVGDAVLSDLISGTGKTPTVKVIIGGYFVTMTLLLVSDSQPELAEGLAVLIMLAVLVGPRGDALLKVIGKLTGNADLKAGVVKSIWSSDQLGSNRTVAGSPGADVGGSPNPTIGSNRSVASGNAGIDR